MLRKAAPKGSYRARPISSFAFARDDDDNAAGFRRIGLMPERKKSVVIAELKLHCRFELPLQSSGQRLAARLWCRTLRCWLVHWCFLCGFRLLRRCHVRQATAQREAEQKHTGRQASHG